MSFLILIELTFVERSRDSGTSKTYPGFSFRYLILLFMYLLCLIKNFIKKSIKIFGRRENE